MLKNAKSLVLVVAWWELKYLNIMSDLALMADNLPHNQCKQVPGGAKLHSTLNGILTWRGYETVTAWETCVSESRHVHLCVCMSERSCERVHVSETRSVCERVMMMMRYRDTPAVVLCRLVLVCQTQGSGHKPKMTAWRYTAQATAVTHTHTLSHTHHCIHLPVSLSWSWWHTHIITLASPTPPWYRHTCSLISLICPILQMWQRWLCCVAWAELADDRAATQRATAAGFASHSSNTVTKQHHYPSFCGCQHWYKQAATARLLWLQNKQRLCV